MKKLIILSAFLFPFLLLKGQVMTEDSCIADFSWKVNHEIMMFAPGIAINFYDESVADSDIESWHWDFGDGHYSDEQNPLFIYTFLDGHPGPFGPNGEFAPKVCLTIKTSGCSSTICKTLEFAHDTIINPEKCHVYFRPYRNDTVMTIPELVQYSFKVYAPENTVSWSWDFGDGTTSNEPDPIHGFDFMGEIFDVCLTIETDDGCSANYCAPVFIGHSDTTYVPGCQALFKWQVMESYPEQYAFQDMSEGNPTAWYWDFGDGTSSSEQNPVHVFASWKDSLDAAGNFFPFPERFYHVCLTISNDEGCKSTYCDIIYSGGWHDTIFPEPCPYFIAITTSNVLGGNFCNGTATASLVDKDGNSVEYSDIQWSTGQTGDSASGLCVNVPYYISITAESGCQVASSFALFDYSRPMDPFGFWTIYGDGYWYNLNYTLPDSGYICQWEFSDGTIVYGEDVSYAFEGDNEKSVTVTVLDEDGNVVYNEAIALNTAVGTKETLTDEYLIYPNPADNVIHIRIQETLEPGASIEIYNSLGKLMLREEFEGNHSNNELSIPVRELGHGLYYVRLLNSGSNPVTLSFVK